MKLRKSLEEIKKILQAKKAILSKEFKVKEIGLFGSFVHGKQRKESDIDILVELEEPVSLLKLVSLENYLTELMKMKTDVVPKKDVRPELRQKILEEVIYI